MKIRTSLIALAVLGLCAVSVCRSNAISAPAAATADSAAPFLGRWDLTLHVGDKAYPSWIELTEKNGQLSAQFVGRWGNARPLPSASLQDGVLTFVSPQKEEGATEDMTFQGKLAAGKLSGTVNGPDGTTWTWTGPRAPSLERSGEPKWGKPISLFNSKDLNGWKSDNPNAPTPWRVEKGALVSPGRSADLVTEGNFEDFKLHIEFNCGVKSNSGVYLRGRYEVQVEDDSIEEPVTHHTGAIYGFLAPSPEQPRQPGAWQTYDITLIGRRVTVVQNGQTVIDNQEIPGITGGALDSNEGLPGPIYLQGSEEGHVEFRNIVITPAKK